MHRPLFKPDPRNPATLDKLVHAKVGEPFSVEMRDARNRRKRSIPAVCTLRVRNGDYLFFFEGVDRAGASIAYHEARELVIQWVRQNS
jgi:hypothetical protein